VSFIEQSAAWSCAALCILAFALTGAAETGEMGDDVIVVKKPSSLKANRLPAKRIPVGKPGDYKPCIAQLPTGELILVMFEPRHLEGGEYQEDIIIYRSTDGGQTWGAREVPPILGREPYLSMARNGTLFLTVHLLQQDRRNKDGYIHSYLHRSTDGGHTWQTVRIGTEDVPGAADKAWIITSRNVLELSDATLIVGVSAPNGHDYLWRSKDGGLTWDRSLACTWEGVSGDQVWWPFWAEMVLWETPAHNLLAIARVDPRIFPAIPGTTLPEYTNDEIERMVVFRSTDGGRTWKNRVDFGDYGEMYSAIQRLRDGRLLLTFTVRSLHPPLGVQAVFGRATADGFEFDFEHDRVVLDAKTPADKPSGGGFGPTVQLVDGTLVTAYSYRDANDQTHVEVVRWSIPTAR